MFRFLGTKEEEVPIERDTIDESDEETLFDSGEENVGIQIKNSMEYGDMTAGYIRTDELLQISSWVYNRSSTRNG